MIIFGYSSEVAVEAIRLVYSYHLGNQSRKTSVKQTLYLLLGNPTYVHTEGFSFFVYF